jgi:hypothetical protein
MASLTNIFVQWKRLFQNNKPRFVGTITSVLGGGRYIVTFQTGDTLIATSEVVYSNAQIVTVEGLEIMGTATSLPTATYDI